jgi:cation transport ATPase
MLKKLWSFIKNYYLFSAAVVAASVALGLDIAGYDSVAHWILIITMVAQLLPMLWGMIQDIREGTYGVDILAATAIIVSIVMGEYWAGMVIVLMLTGGESLEDYAEHRARRELDALLKRAPHKARILRGKTEVDVKASEVIVGDKVVVRPGEVVPVDGIIRRHCQRRRVESYRRKHTQPKE